MHPQKLWLAAQSPKLFVQPFGEIGERLGRRAEKSVLPFELGESPPQFCDFPIHTRS